MRPEVESIHERMSQGGDWRSFRDEITHLHGTATSEQERVRLLEAFANLVAVGPHAFDEATWAKLQPLASADYRMMLLAETVDGPDFNPVLLDRVTAREAAAGRMTEADELRSMARAGATVLGDSAIIRTPRRRIGTWFFLGTVAAAAIVFIALKEGWLALGIAITGLVAGTWLNSREETRIKTQVRERRAAE